jgi:hypothetical protein
MKGARTQHLGWKRRWPYLCLLLLVVVVVSVSVAPALATSAFSDVSPGYRYSTAIESMASLGIIGGYPDGTFKPDNLVMRKHFAKMIVGTMGLTVTEDDWSDANPPFIDCGPDDLTDIYPHDYIAVAKANGLTSGKTTTTFAPGAFITRAQMVTMVVRAAQNFGIELEPVGAGYSGVFQSYNDPNHGANVHIAEFNLLLEGLVTSGTPSSWMAANATRGEVAQVLWNLYELSGALPPDSSPELLFSDDFSTKAYGWSEWDSTQSRVAYDTAAGRYLITPKVTDWYAWSWLDGWYGDCMIEVDAACLSATKEGLYGIIFRVDDPGDNMYEFLVSNQGYWQLWRMTDGEEDYLTDSKSNSSSAINTGAAWNHLTVVADGTTINLYINGTNVFELDEALLTEGEVGLEGGSGLTSSNVTLAFDNFEIWSLYE